MKNKKKRQETIWLNNGWFPFYYGFCPSKKAWNRTLKHWKIDPKKNPYPVEDGSTQVFENKKTNGLSLIVTIQQNECPIKTFGLIAHEATHVWQYLKKHIGEDSPSPEFEAYAIQSITQELITAACEVWGVESVFKPIGK